VLSLLVVRWVAVAALATTVLVVSLGVLARHRAGPPAPVAASTTPIAGTQSLWILGTVVAVLWPLAVLVVPSVAYDWPRSPDFGGSTALQGVGIALGVTGGGLYLTAVRSLGNQMTPAIQLQQGHRLIQDGPYRWIRNPIYTAILLVAGAQTLSYLSPLAGALTVVLAGLAVYRVRLEEELLRSPAGFAAEYESYVARTGRFLPRWGPAR
jgi:protein-S-isoprenylcysteine O-methyltransferase Ste14